MSKFGRLLLFLVLAKLCFGQMKDTSPRNANNGTSLPSTCSVGSMFFKSDATAGQNLYGCTATNAWTLQAGNGGGGGTALITAVSTVGGPPATATIVHSFGLVNKFGFTATCYDTTKMIGLQDIIPIDGNSTTITTASPASLTCVLLSSSATGGGGGGGVITSVFGRIGTVVAETGDYSFSQLSGFLAAGQLPALTGDITSSSGSAATTLVASGVSAGTCGTATQSCSLIVDLKGRITVMSNTLITSAFSSLTGTLAGAQLPTLTGDVTNTAAAVTVTGIRGRPVLSGTPANSQVYCWVTANNEWELCNQTGTGSNATTIQSRNVAATAPADTEVLCWSASGNTWQPCTAASGGGASSISGLTDLNVTRTTSTNLNVAAGTVQVNGVATNILLGTVGVSAGTGTVRIAIDTSVNPPIGRVIYSSGITATCSGMGGCTTPVVGSTFGDDDIQIRSWTVTAGTFDVGTGTDLRGISSRSRTVAGTGITSTFSGGTQTLAVNTTALPIFTLLPGTGTALASATTITPTNRGHHVTGTTPVATITATGMIDGELLYVMPDGAFTTTTLGNIAITSTAVVGKLLVFHWDATAVKWYPSY